MSKTRRAVVVTASVSILVIACIGSGVLYVAHELRRRDAVEQRIGAVIGSPYVTLDGHDREVIAFFYIAPGGPAAKAGLNEGDILVEDVSIGELCRRFSAPTGTHAVVEVVPGGDGNRLSERRNRKVSILLP